MDSRTARLKLPLSVDLLLACVWLILAILLISSVFNHGFLFYPIVTALSLATGAFIIRQWPAKADFGWANRVTLFRGVLVMVLVSLAPFLGNLNSGNTFGNSLWLYVSLSVIALILDGADGYIARATNTESPFGARFDMELDALFILGLCLAALSLDRAGFWVLALGLMRYVFVAAGYRWPFLQRPLPDSFRRKTVCVWQLVTLMVAILPVTPNALAHWSLVWALALLCYSFAIDIRWLCRTRSS